jgi:hypothetical protein
MRRFLMGVICAALLAWVACGTEEDKAASVVATPPPTAVPTPSPTPKDVYRTRVDAELKALAERSTFLGTAGAALSGGDTASLATFRKAIDDVLAGTAKVRMITPPTCLQEAHATLVRAMDSYDAAMQAMTQYARLAEQRNSGARAILAIAEERADAGDRVRDLALATAQRATC